MAAGSAPTPLRAAPRGAACCCAIRSSSCRRNNHNNNTLENKDLKQLLQRKSLTPEDALKIKEMMINETQQGNSNNNNNDSNGNTDQQQKRKSSDGTKKKRNSNPKKTIPSKTKVVHSRFRNTDAFEVFFCGWVSASGM